MKSDNQKYNESISSSTSLLTKLKTTIPEFFSRNGEFDLLKFRKVLSKQNIDELMTGYQLNFIGKDYAKRLAGELPETVLVPDVKHNLGVNEESNNIFFIGDNIEVLRHMCGSYSGKIKVIYIDPPYNTGNKDFAYDDDFKYSDEELQAMFGLDEDQLARLKSIQGRSSHSAWLTFMYPRLEIAKRLLARDGIIFISIDDNEFSNLKEICDEIFGEINFLGNLVWKARAKPSNQGAAKLRPQGDVEYILTYSKNYQDAKFFPIESTGKRSYPYEFNGRKYRLTTILKSNRGINSRGTMTFEFHGYKPSSGSRWQAGEEKIEQLWNSNHLEFKHGTPFQRYFEDEEKELRHPFYSFMEPQNTGTTEQGKIELNDLIGNDHGFDTVKPTKLIKYILKATTRDDDIVLDFFGGSGTTAQAVMELNNEDGGKRSFILAQISSPIKIGNLSKSVNKEDEADASITTNEPYSTIDQITQKRIEKASENLSKCASVEIEKTDLGYKIYRAVALKNKTLDAIEEFNPDDNNLFSDMVKNFSAASMHVAGGATGEQTILTTWMAKDGLDFNTCALKIDLEGYISYQVENRLYLISDGWTSESTKSLLNRLGKHELDVQTVILFGYSFNIAELRELESGLKQLDNSVSLIKRY